MKMIPVHSRQVHLDFHTSEACDAVGADFDEAAFVDALRLGHVDCINVFALCHHGWCYYPTEIGAVHPTLETDLLGRMMGTCREAGIETVVYVSMGWNERLFRERPDWACRAVDGGLLGPAEAHPSSPRPFYGWHRMCFNTPYLEYTLSIVCEIAARYRPSGFWFDITGPVACACPSCAGGARAAGLDPTNQADLAAFGKVVFKQYLRKTSAAVWNTLPDASVYHNWSTEPAKADRELLDSYTHLEVESLPTGFWGYEFFPVNAKYVKPLVGDHLVVGMTGKFHLSWGEFGGFKTPTAMRYEVARILAHGCVPSIGDQLHPSGAIERDTYRLIGSAYREVEALEPWIEGSVPLADVAIISPTVAVATGASRAGADDGTRASEYGASLALTEMHVPHLIVDPWADLSPYRLVVLPDSIHVDAAFATRLEAFVEAGGALLLTGESGLTGPGAWPPAPAEGAASFAIDVGAEFAGPSVCDVEYVAVGEVLAGTGATPVADAGVPYLPGAPVLVYESGITVRATDGEVLAMTHEPIFNRTYGRFCSHRSSPPQLEPARPAIVRKGRVVHVSQPLFRSYRQQGAVMVRRILERCIDLIYPDRFLRASLATAVPGTTALPSAAEVCVTRQRAHDRLIVHLLHATPVKRGVTRGAGDREITVRVVEDAVPLPPVELALRIATRPTSVHTAPNGDRLEFGYEDSVMTCTVPSFATCCRVVIDLGG
jgi:hypothetical protein